MNSVSPSKVVFQNQRFQVTNKVLGEGGSGVVTRGISIHSDSPVAVKTVSDRIAAQIEVSGLQFEIPHTVRFRDGFDRDEADYSIVMDEIIGGNIFDVFLCPEKSTMKLSLTEIKSIASQLFEVLEDLEEKSLINYDIKPQNLMWNRLSNSLTMVDLASVRDFTESYETEPDITVDYLAPEVILEGEADCSYNIWSTACVLFELIVGKKLFSKHPQHIEDYNHVLMQIVQQIGKPSLEYLKQLEKEDLEFNNLPPIIRWEMQLREALVQRGASEVQIQQWIDLLSSMLRYENRANPKDLIANPLFQEEIKVDLRLDRRIKCMMQLTRASKGENGSDVTFDFRVEKNCCLHIPKDPNDQYVLVLTNGAKEIRSVITLKSGGVLDILSYQLQVDTVKKNLFGEEPQTKRSKV